jgi:hypothetical protein
LGIATNPHKGADRSLFSLAFASVFLQIVSSFATSSLLAILFVGGLALARVTVLWRAGNTDFE